MFLKTSISTTKKLFQKTVDGVKSFFSSGYQKIPRSPPCSPLFPCIGGGVSTNVMSQSYTELDKYYTDFNSHWDCEKDHKNPKKKNKKIVSSPANIKVSPRKSNYQVLEKEREDQHNEVREKLVRFGSAKITNNNYQVVGSKEDVKRKKSIMYEGKKKYKEFSGSMELREERSYLVAQKLKELKMLEKSNEEHALDIEEVLHYYSRLTCPAYVEIVDKFFMEMYSELFNQQAKSSCGYTNPNMGLRRVELY